MRRTLLSCAAAGLFLGAVPESARAQVTSIVYIDTASAPPALQKKIEDGLRVVLAEKGVTLGNDPSSLASPAAAATETRMAAAKRDLEKGLAAYRELSLDAAVAALLSAESAALASADSPHAPALLADVRIYLGIIALANGNAAEADKAFRKVAVADPDRRLDTKSFPPDRVAAFEKARKAVAAGPTVELSVTVEPEGASLFVDGRLATAVVRLPAGEHLISAQLENAFAGERIDLGVAKASRTLRVQPDSSRLVAAVRTAAKKDDEAVLARACDALADALHTERLLLWAISKSSKGGIEAPLRIRDPFDATFSRTVVADLGTAAIVETPLRTALTALLAPPGKTVAAAGKKAPKPPRPPREGVAGWVWWVGGGVAILAAGGAAAALAQPASGANDTVAITVEK